MIGIIGAMDEEVAKIVEAMEIERQEDKACMSFKAGKLNGKDVVVVRSGIGKVNAAVHRYLWMISVLIMLLIQELQVHLRLRLILQILLYQVMYYITIWMLQDLDIL